ncbi:MAG: hypothetical protein CMC35_08170 [Flavobacteriaceae bacterium]|nr:hypothetical protein [Flavobacteriaceae bacterium]|tara:strand:- start:24758 stop:26272 length:1515 start_codon:yes stop_codon:yes gene_type:complete
MWIICAGGKRSGSTLQYNIMANMVEIAGVGKRLSHFDSKEFPAVKEAESTYKGFNVFKTHGLTAELAREVNQGNAIVIHCYRDVRDVIMSSINKGWIKEQNDTVQHATKTYLQEHEAWTTLNGKVLSRKYEDFAFSVPSEIEVLASFLEIELSDAQIQDIAEKVDRNTLKKVQSDIPEAKRRESSKQVFHSETLLHTNHIFDGSKDQFKKGLRPHSICLIEALAHRFLVNHGYELYWSKTDEFLSFSQHADDYIAWQLLGKPATGTIMEVGAFDGVHLSNSLSLEQKGWKAVCVEANPRFYTFLEQQRPKATNINKAVVSDAETKEIAFYDEEIGVLSGVTFDEEDIKKRYENRGLPYTAPKKIIVPAETLDRICASERLERIHVMSIDIEGFELQALQGLNLKKVIVDLFIIEANSEEEKASIKQFFSKWKKYRFIGRNRQNLFFIRKSVAKKRNFKNLDLEGYVRAKQFHPVSDHLSIEAVEPRFYESDQFEKIVNSFSLFS